MPLGADEVAIATMPAGEERATVAITGQFAGPLSGFSAAPEAPFSLSAEVAGADEVAIRLPFDLWTVQLTHQGQFAVIDLSAWDLLLGDMWPDRFAARAGQESVNVEPMTVASIPVPAGTASLPCKVTFISTNGAVSEVDVVLTQGSFEITAEGLVPQR
jgi:hypothetical protein